MLFRKKPAEERSPQELEIALQEAEMPQKGLKPFLHKNGKKLVAVLVVLVLLIALFAPKGKKKAVSAETQYTTVSPENRDITNVYSRIRRAERRQQLHRQGDGQGRCPDRGF